MPLDIPTRVGGGCHVMSGGGSPALPIYEEEDAFLREFRCVACDSRLSPTRATKPRYHPSRLPRRHAALAVRSLCTETRICLRRFHTRTTQCLLRDGDLTHFCRRHPLDPLAHARAHARIRTVRALPVLRSMCSRNAVLEELAQVESEGQEENREITDKGKQAKSRWWRRFSYYERAMVMQGGPPQNAVQTALAERTEMRKAGMRPSFSQKVASGGPAAAASGDFKGMRTRSRGTSIHKQPDLVGSSLHTIKPLVQFQRSLIDQRIQQKRRTAVMQPGLSEEGYQKPRWTGDATERALAKISKVSIYFDPIDPRNRRALEGFSGPKLSYDDFRHQLQISLGIRLTKAELAAAAKQFDPEADGFVSGADFARHFFRSGFESRQLTRTQKLREQYENEERVRKGIRAVEQADNDELQQDVCAPFTEDDWDSAIAKLGKIARTWDAGYTADKINLAAFGSRMTMFEFQQQLFKVRAWCVVQGGSSSMHSIHADSS